MGLHNKCFSDNLLLITIFSNTIVVQTTEALYLKVEKAAFL